MYLYIAFAIPAMVMAGILIWHNGLRRRKLSKQYSDPSYS